MDAQALHPMISLVETFGHSALALYTALKRHAKKIAFQIISPGMIYAFKIRNIASQISAYQRAPMGAAIHQNIYIAI